MVVSRVAVKIPIAVSVFLILVLLVLGAPKRASIREHNGLMTSGTGSFDLADAATHSPIVIDGDDDLKAQGWPGNGTEADPYVIEDLIIETSETCISLSNTRAFLLIRGCTLRNVNQFARSGTGISLTNVINVRVGNCTIIDKYSGVKSESSSPCCNVSIVSTTCEHISYPFTLQCDNLTIDNCSVADASYGIFLSDSGNCTVSNSVVSDCNHYGIYVTGLTTIHGPEDMTFESGMSNFYLLWDPVDTPPRDYSIFDNASVIKSGTWNNSLETIAIDVSGFAPGTHNVTLLVHDADGNAASCSTLVNVLPSGPPEIVPPPDLTYTEGTIGNVIAWSMSDDSPSIYEVTRNDSLIASGVWQVGTIEVRVDRLSPGTYVFVLTVKDMAGNSANDTVLVTVLPRETTTTQTTQTTTVTGPVPGTMNTTTTGGGTPAPTEFRILGLFPISFAITVAGLCVIVIVAVNYVRLKCLHSGA
ncbi:MAG: hypothetical protein DRO93_13015 [Candidatus Thorarchaeota archaeon]|nr:MAG: hypothetical protein DRO93_13015 [Candidatus Thorarchaeota archaeon]